MTALASSGAPSDILLRWLAAVLASASCGRPKRPLRAGTTLLFLTFLSFPALAQDAIVGKARVVDGDTIEVAGTRIRLEGIDASERGQGCQHHLAHLGHFDKNAG